MITSGIGSPNLTRLPSLPSTARDGVRTPVQQPAAPQTARTGRAASAPSAAAAQSVPVDPPPGTDPALWSVLSSDERAFFAKAGAMGPLTYGRALQQMKAAPMPASRGGRLDVKI
jgi:hypothetical protein